MCCSSSRPGDRATCRLLATRPAGLPALPFGQPGPAVPVDRLQRLLDDAPLAARITDLTWSTRVPVQHRLTDLSRRDRVFLAGDAAHGHSPAAAQGTAIQEATNLGWKVAFAAGRSAPEQLLDSYELERRPVAERVSGLTQLVFGLESATDPVSSFVRGTIASLAAPLAAADRRGRRRLIAPALRLLSQLSVNYRRSPLSMDGAAVLHRGFRAGDRLPDGVVTCDGETLRLHELLAGRA